MEMGCQVTEPVCYSQSVKNRGLPICECLLGKRSQHIQPRKVPALESLSPRACPDDLPGQLSPARRNPAHVDPPEQSSAPFGLGSRDC